MFIKAIKCNYCPTIIDYSNLNEYDLRVLGWILLGGIAQVTGHVCPQCAQVCKGCIFLHHGRCHVKDAKPSCQMKGENND